MQLTIEMKDLDFVGETLDGKYQMTRELGRGGMGTVYLATHLGTERPVAVKIIAPQFMQRTEFVERFRREARAAGRLRHPNVVNVTDFGFAASKCGEVAYLVMEYLDGCTLGEILEEEKNLPVGWTLDILEQVCSAVQEAHEQGIIHRDLKPDNIWLEPNQRGG
ncbi:MAG TPA: serine/threonine-protein kinase [Pyrinomonadaceae bacterium]|nr:serine/threonine-protein kinase [Pyrinomonadaceae bacterium]